MARKRAEILIAKAWRDAANSALNSAVATGQVFIPDMYIRALARVLLPIWGRAARDNSAAVMKEIKGGFDLEIKQTLWEEFAAEYSRQFGSRAVANIMDGVRNLIIAEIEKGLRDGRTLEAIAADMRDRIPSFSRLRAATIARTETHSAAQWAGLETARSARFPLVKVWNSVTDHRTRDFGEADGVADSANHRAMNGVSVALNDPFQVPNKFGGFDAMQFCGDQNAPVFQVVNCRCALSFKRAARVIA